MPTDRGYPTYRELFPDFDDALPEVEGFYDNSYRDDICPKLTSDELGIHLFYDYKDMELSEFKEWRKDGSVGRFRLLQCSDALEPYDYGNPKNYIETNDFDEVLAVVDELRAKATPSP